MAWRIDGRQRFNEHSLDFLKWWGLGGFFQWESDAQARCMTGRNRNLF